MYRRGRGWRRRPYWGGGWGWGWRRPMFGFGRFPGCGCLFVLALLGLCAVRDGILPRAVLVLPLG